MKIGEFISTHIPGVFLFLVLLFVLVRFLPSVLKNIRYRRLKVQRAQRIRVLALQRQQQEKMHLQECKMKDSLCEGSGIRRGSKIVVDHKTNRILPIFLPH